MGSSSKKKAQELQERNEKLEEKYRRMQHALRAAQEKANKAEEDRDSAARKLAEVTNTQNAHAGQRRTHAQRTEDSGASESEAPPAKRAALESGNPAPSKELKAEVRELGAKFALEYGLWLDNPEILGTKKHPYLRVYDPAQRFEDQGSPEKNLAMRAQGQVRELEQFLPRRLWSQRVEPWFGVQFKAGMRQQVSNMASRIRSHPCKILGPEIATLLNETDGEVNTRFKHFAVRIGFQPATATEPQRYSALKCPIIRYPEDGETIDSLFRARGAQWIAIAFLRGVISAQKSRQSNGTVIHIPTQRHIQRMFEITRTRAALISTSCIFFRFCVSGDVEFAERGDRTTIDYQKDFNTYLSILLDGLRTQSQPILDVFAEWDRVVFGRTDTQRTTEVRTSEHADRDELAALRAEMAAAAPAIDESSPGSPVQDQQGRSNERRSQEPRIEHGAVDELTQEALDEIADDPSAGEESESEDGPVLARKKKDGKAGKRVITDSELESEDES